MPSVVITGASSGIGWGAAKVMIAKGFRVFGSVRNEADASRLSREFGPAFTPLLMDVTDHAAVQAAASSVRDSLAGEPLSGLVNNAGVAVPGPLLYLRPEELRRQFEVNVVGVLAVTQAFAPLLGIRTKEPGRIVVVTSVGGRTGVPLLGAYCASKFALEGMTDSLRRELRMLGIRVVTIAPGAVATAMPEKGAATDISEFTQTPYAASLERLRAVSATSGGLPPERLGEAIWKALTIRRPKARYVVTPTPVRNYLGEHLPVRLVDSLLSTRP